MSSPPSSSSWRSSPLYFETGGPGRARSSVRSLPPRGPLECPGESEACWSERDTQHSGTFRDLRRTAWYEMSARVIDDGGSGRRHSRDAPFLSCFSTTWSLVRSSALSNRQLGQGRFADQRRRINQGCGRLEGRQAHTFLINARRTSSRNDETARSDLAVPRPAPRAGRVALCDAPLGSVHPVDSFSG